MGKRRGCEADIHSPYDFQMGSGCRPTTDRE